MQVGGVFRNLRLKLVFLAILLLICGAGGVKFRGVSVRNRRYFCSVRVPGKNYVLWVGTYDTELEAARAYDVAAHYVGKNRREFNFYDYHPRLESVLAPFPSHLSLNKENKGAVTEFITTQAEGFLQVYRRRLLRSDDVQTVTVQHLQPGVHQTDQIPAHAEPHFDWTQVSPSHADLNHVLDVPEHDFPSRELDSFDFDDLTFLQEAVFSSEVETLCTVQQSCQADNIVTEPNEGGLGGQILEQLGQQAPIEHSCSLLPHTQTQPMLDYPARIEEFLLSDPDVALFVAPPVEAPVQPNVAPIVAPPAVAPAQPNVARFDGPRDAALVQPNVVPPNVALPGGVPAQQNVAPNVARPAPAQPNVALIVAPPAQPIAAAIVALPNLTGAFDINRGLERSRLRPLRTFMFEPDGNFWPKL